MLQKMKWNVMFVILSNDDIENEFYVLFVFNAYIEFRYVAISIMLTITLLT